MALIDEIESVGKTVRIMVMLEVRPLSDQYEQVKLTHAQFKEISEIIHRVHRPIGGKVMITTVGDPVNVPNVQQHT